MALIEFKNLPDTSTPLNEENLNNNFEEFVGIILYSSNGTATTLTLSDSVTNYSYLEIYFRTNDGANYESSAKISSPNNKFASLTYFYAVGNYMYIKNANCNITNTTIQFSKNTESRYSNNGSITLADGDYIYITKVVGYK